MKSCRRYTFDSRTNNRRDRVKLSSALLKAQMTIEAKIHDKRDARDKRLFDLYIKEQTAYIDDCFSAANYLIDNATLAILEMMDATEDYEYQHGKKDP